MPSIGGVGKSASWHLEKSIRALDFIRLSDNLPNICCKHIHSSRLESCIIIRFVCLLRLYVILRSGSESQKMTKKSLVKVKKLYFRASLEYFCISLVHIFLFFPVYILVFSCLYFSISLFIFAHQLLLLPHQQRQELRAGSE